MVSAPDPDGPVMRFTRRDHQRMGYSVYPSHRLALLSPRDLPMDQCPILRQTPAVQTCSRACSLRGVVQGG